ncbi:hypothetical protein Tco_0221801 [Tanacetum coccineum]
MVPPTNLGPDLSGKAVNETRYRGMIGSLMYLTASRPDIQFSTCLCSDLKGYSNSDYAGCNMDRKSTSSACQLLGGKLVAMSSAEAEYVAAAGCCANILWMKSQLTDYDIIYEKHASDELTFKRLIVELGMLNIDSKPEASVLPEEN